MNKPNANTVLLVNDDGVVLWDRDLIEPCVKVSNYEEGVTLQQLIDDCSDFIPFNLEMVGQIH